MEYQQLGNTDLKVSKVCLGAFSVSGAWGAFDENEFIGAVQHAWDLGINFFDTAQAYGFGTSEKLLGRALRQQILTRRDEVVLATKGGLRLDGDKIIRDSSAAWLRQGLLESLDYLGTDYIDLYQVHWPDFNIPIEETVSVLEDFIREGKVRRVGVSNFTTEQMEAFQRAGTLDSVQPPYSMLTRDAEKDILPYCQSHGLGVLCYGPLAHGILCGNWAADKCFPAEDWRCRWPGFTGDGLHKNIEMIENLKVYAHGRGSTVGQLAVAWVLANPAVDVAIVGARRPGQIAETAAAADLRLTQEDLEEIDKILQDGSPFVEPTPEGF